MSQTSTVPQTRTAISRSSSILLSPSKRRKLDDVQPKQQPAKSDAQIAPVRAPLETENAEQPQPTVAELYRWTFTRAAAAACFVRDVFEMKASGFRDMEFFWLGRIPCRTVRLTGLLVGVAVWDKRTVYTVDDGTAVLDCAFAHAQAVPPSPVKPKAKAAVPVAHATKRTGPSFSDYHLSARKVIPTTSSTPATRPEPPPPPKPVARVGQSVRVIGRVVSRHDTRILLVDEILCCTSFNDEPNHWLIVSELHRTTYYPSQLLPAFVPPPLPTQSAFPSHSRPDSPSKRAATQEPTTPASVRFAAPSANTSPSTSVAASSPASSTDGEIKIRLRHPSRLHTRDLTTNTFRIYVKHYMDNAPPPPRLRCRSEARSVSPSPTPCRSQTRGVEETTKFRGRKREASTDATPRPSRLRRIGEDRTPRASQVSKAETDTESDDEDVSEEGDNQMYGFTLSHLRRVPELSLLGRRVIAADARRREKEERKKAKEKASSATDKGKGKATASSSSSSRGQSQPQLPAGPAVKKLFKQAIRTLFQEGDIVLWSGPVRPLPAPPLDPMVPSSSALWRATTSTSSAISSASSRSSRSQPNYEEWDDDEVLSDPQPNEEAYVPLTPAYFSRVLEDAIWRMVGNEENAHASRSGKEGGLGGKAEATPKPASKSIIERLKAHEKERGTGLPPGPTKEELLAWLRNNDERWARVGEWTVQEGLDWGRKEGRLWCVGKGRWEVCG